MSSVAEPLPREPKTAPVPPGLAVRLELAEAEAWADFHRSAVGRPAADCGADAFALGEAQIVVASRVDVLALNRVIGLGLGREAESRHLDLVDETYRRLEVPRFFVQLSPDATPSSLERELCRRGFEPYNHWIRLCRRAEPLPQPPTDLVIRKIGADEAPAFGRIFAEAAGWPAATAPWVAATVGRPGWRHYLAFDGLRPVATGALYSRGDIAWIDFASTRPSHRGRGAQSALLARRVSEAASLGCRWTTVETADHREGRPAPAFRNARRLGFEALYRRPNFLFRR